MQFVTNQPLTPFAKMRMQRFIAQERARLLAQYEMAMKEYAMQRHPVAFSGEGAASEEPLGNVITLPTSHKPH